jgi:hypothetical protein
MREAESDHHSFRKSLILSRKHPTGRLCSYISIRMEMPLKYSRKVKAKKKEKVSENILEKKSTIKRL